MFKYRENKPYAYIGDENYIFISYSRKDKEIVYNDLLEMNKLKVRFWYDDDIEAGVKWTEKVKKIISSPHCVGVVFYLSKNVLSSEAIENEIKMVIGINDAQRKKYFSLLIDYDQTDYSLSNIIKNELMKDNSLEFSSRCSLINSIFGGEINYLFRSPKVDSLSHFYKMISRIVNFGAVPIEALKKISADYSDFSFYDIDKDIGIKKYTGKENIVRIPEKVYGKAIIEIGEYAFAKNQTIEEVFIPNTLKDIKSNAFLSVST